MKLKLLAFVAIVAMWGTSPIQAQDDLPTPEAFAKGCMDDLVLSIQQVTIYFESLDRILEGREPKLSIELVEEVEKELLAEVARTEIKAKSCDKIAAMLGENYTIHLNKVMETPEVKLALFEYMIVIEELKLKMASMDGREDMFEEHLAEEELIRKEEELIARTLAEDSQQNLNSLSDAYILAIRQKVERNWMKPTGNGNMPVCEVLVLQGPGGIILDVDFGACDDSTANYRASIENAIYKAEPLPSPGDPELFERQLILFFNPSVQ
jgi:hypothetical protein